MSQPPIQPTAQFDDLPIPAASQNNHQFAIPQFAQSQQPPPESINMTLLQKLASKAIKIRMQGLQQLSQALLRAKKNKSSETDDENFSAITMSKVLKQNNPACIEKAIVCMNDWMSLERSWGNSQIKEVIQSGYINGKGNAKKSSVELVEKMFQEKAEAVEGAIMEGLKSKTPKIVGGYLGILNELISAFGMKPLKFLKPYISDIVRIMNTEKLPAVKNQGMNLLKTGYKWVGKDFFTQYIKDLKENIQKELDNFWESHDKNQKMVSKKENQPKKKSNNDTTNIQQKSIPNFTQDNFDLYEISQPVDALKDFDEKWVDSVLLSEKWSVKVKLLQDCQNAVSVPKIMNRQCRHVVEMLRRLLTDSNFNVVLNTLKLAGLLAKGLRKSFAHSTKILIPSILPKFRDKKTQMIEETFTTLNNFVYSINLEQISQDIKSGLKDKTPSAKQHLIDWISKVMSQKTEENTKNGDRTVEFINSLGDYFQKLLADPSLEVREAASKLLNIMKQISPESKLVNSNLNASKIVESKAVQKKQVRDVSKSTGKNRKLSQSKIKSQTKINISEQKNDITISELMNDFPKIMKKLNDSGNWENRKQAAEQLISQFQQLSTTETKLPATSTINDYLGIIKLRISDPNKQLIRLFISLIGNTFLMLSEKEAKIHYRPFIQSLAESLSDKNETNKKQTFKTLDIIGQIVGQEQVIITLNQSILNENNYRVYCLQYMLIWEQTFEKMNKNDLKEFPKSIINCLCDKNREIKTKSENILKIISSKIPAQAFKNVIKDVKQAFKNQLGNLIEKYYGNNTSSIITDASFYSTKSINPKQTSRKASPSTSKYDLSKSKYRQKESNSKAKDNHMQQNNSQYGSRFNNSSLMKSNLGILDNQYFASLNLLMEERIEREEKDQRYRHNFSAINFCEQNRVSITKLMNYEQFASKMLSDDYRQNIQGSISLIKLCRDSSQHSSIREVYDLILKWVAIKFYGGNTTVLPLIELIPPILSVLQKKKIAFAQRDIDLIFQIIREYALAAHWIDSISYQALKSIIVISIPLSSGERLIKKILLEFRHQYSSTHRHCRKHTNKAYRSVLAYLCEILSDYFNNDTLLMQAGKIEQLSHSTEFYKKLKQKFHGNILKQFGFDEEVFKIENSSVRDHSIGKEQVKSSFVNSRVDLKHSKNNERSKSKKRASNQPSKNPSFSSQMIIKQDQNPRFGQTSQSVWPQPSQQQKFSRNSSSNYLKISLVDKQENQKNSHQQQRYVTLQGDCDYQIDLSKYSTVNSLSPLGNNLKKLYPPNDQTMGFFTTLMQENGEKITDELVRNSEIIYGTIFNTLILIMKNREDFSPQKIVSFTNLVQLAIRCTHIFKKIQDSLIAHSCQYIVGQLVYQDENRTMIQSRLHDRGYTDIKSDCFIKAINGIMLRILDHTPPLFIINILLEMLTFLNTKKSGSAHTTNKKIGLIIRCITRVSSTCFNPQSSTYTYQKQKSDKTIINFFAIAKEYLDAMGIMSLVSAYKKYGHNIQKNSKSQQSITQTIYNVLNVLSKETSKQNSNKMWKLYNSYKADLLSHRQEILIKQYLQFVMGPEKVSEPSQSGHLNEQKKDNYSRQDNQLRQITELLAKARTFQQGISYLKEFMLKNKNFDLDQYFQRMNFDRGFIHKVKSELKSITTQSSKNNLNPDIQNKLDNLKKKLQIMQIKSPMDSSNLPPHKRDKSSHYMENPSRCQNLTPKNRRDYSNNGQQKINSNRDENHNDVKRRIQDMKNRIHMTATNRLR